MTRQEAWIRHQATVQRIRDQLNAEREQRQSVYDSLGLDYPQEDLSPGQNIGQAKTTGLPCHQDQRQRARVWSQWRPL